ncbi:MAG: cyclase family protein [Leucobacter sp.]
MTFIDISPAVRPGAPVWPGDQDFALVPRWSIDAGDSVSVATITTTAHVGAHIDAPSHVIAGAASVFETPLDACVGTCLVLDVSDLVDRGRSPHGQAAGAAVRDRVERMAEEPVERLLLRHRARPANAWDPHLPGVDPELMRWFGDQGGRLMGIDIASFDPADSKQLRCHRAGIEAGVVLLEGLDLAPAPEGAAELIALPLAWPGADASPVRAVLRIA